MLLLIEIAGLPRSTYYYYAQSKNKQDRYGEIKEQILKHLVNVVRATVNLLWLPTDLKALPHIYIYAYNILIHWSKKSNIFF